VPPSLWRGTPPPAAPPEQLSSIPLVRYGGRECQCHSVPLRRGGGGGSSREAAVRWRSRLGPLAAGATRVPPQAQALRRAGASCPSVAGGVGWRGRWGRRRRRHGPPPPGAHRLPRQRDRGLPRRRRRQPAPPPRRHRPGLRHPSLRQLAWGLPQVRSSLPSLPGFHFNPPPLAFMYSSSHHRRLLLISMPASLINPTQGLHLLPLLQYTNSSSPYTKQLLASGVHSAISQQTLHQNNNTSASCSMFCITTELCGQNNSGGPRNFVEPGRS
jgi:hypothetical protein